MNYIIIVKPKYGGREKAYPVLFDTEINAEIQVVKMRTKFNDYQVRKVS